jgi:hypothetical protein
MGAATTSEKDVEGLLSVLWVAPLRAKAQLGMRQQVQRQWISALNRRGQRPRTNWTRLKGQPWFKLPFAQNLHSMTEAYFSQCHLGSPVREICTPGSAFGETRSSGHAYSVRRQRESAPRREAPHRLASSRLVSTIPFDLWADGRSRWMASEGGAGLLPIPCSSREHDTVAHLQTSRVQAIAERSGPPQSARGDALGTSYPSPKPVDSSTPRSAPLS